MSGNLGDVLWDMTRYDEEPTVAQQLGPLAQGLDPEELSQAAGTAIVEGRFDDAIVLGELAASGPS